MGPWRDRADCLGPSGLGIGAVSPRPSSGVRPAVRGWGRARRASRVPRPSRVRAREQRGRKTCLRRLGSVWKETQNLCPHGFAPPSWAFSDRLCGVGPRGVVPFKLFNAAFPPHLLLNLVTRSVWGCGMVGTGLTPARPGCVWKPRGRRTKRVRTVSTWIVNPRPLVFGA